jgi:undecaprenyl-diphosphatase
MTSRFRRRGVRLVAWGVALLVPVLVAFARMYRGMHHPLDVAGGVIVGIGAVMVLLFACRAAEAAVRAPEHSRGRVASRSRMGTAS